MKLFLVGANSPTGRGLIEILRKNKIRFLAPADKNFDPDNGPAITRMVAEFAPTQLINMADFISRNHSALKRAESSEQRCRRINALLPATLAGTCNQLNIPMLHLSNSYVFDGEKKLGYSEIDDPNPQGVYGSCTLEGEEAVRKHPAHIIMRSGWLFGNHKIGLIKSWIHSIKKHQGELTVLRRRFSPTPTTDMAAALLAVVRQVDCDANVWGTYHYSGLEIKKEIEFARQTLKYAANHDEEIYQLLDNTKIRENLPRLPELPNSTLSSKKIFDTFGIKQKSWHGYLQETVKTLYVGRLRTKDEQRPDSTAA
ncbi:MAG: sugar nucleotide-binding protein [Pseudohongiellaceae bacterium]